MQACTPVASAFLDPTLMDASGSYLSSPGTPNHTKCNNKNFFPLHTYCNKCLDWAKTKWKLVWVCVLTSLDRSVGLFRNPCYFHLLSGHSLLRLLFLSSSFNSKWEPFCFVASDFHVRTASWSAPADVQAFWSIHLFRDFLSGKALYSHPYLGGFQSN